MHPTTRPEKAAAKPGLDELAAAVNEAARQCDVATSQTVASGMVTVQAAITAGNHLLRAKAIIAPKRFLAWLTKECPKVNERTAQRWMKLAKATRSSDLSDAKSIADAFRIIQEVQGEREKPALQAIGTQAVNLYVEITNRFARRSRTLLDDATEVLSEIDRMPEEQKDIARSALQPLVNIGAKLGIVPDEQEPA